jgi:hypothetical protein
MTANGNDDSAFSLLRLVPGVLRARDYRLYTQGGRRLVDLWLNGGAAILGHTPPSLLREIKNTASRGLYAPLPHVLEGRFIKALSRIFPERAFRLYSSAPAALNGMIKDGSAGLWRPFLDPADPLAVAHNAPPVLIPVLPGIQNWYPAAVEAPLPRGLCALAVDPACANQAALPPGEFLSPVLLAAAVRGIYDLIAAAPARVKLPFPRIMQALKGGRWQRRGIYLTLRQEAAGESWAALFRCFLDAGFLLPPVPGHPVILPGLLSPGEEAKLAETLAAPVY